jgi:hypothetical protein
MSIQEGEDDEDITMSDTTTPSIEVQGPITRSRAQQLRCKVNSFLCSTANYLENRLPPNDLIVIKNQGMDHGGNVGYQEGAGEPRKHRQQGGGPSQFGVQESDFKSNSKSKTTLPSNFHIGRIQPLIWVMYIYVWKDKEIIFPMPPVSWLTTIEVNHNHQNKTDFQNLPGDAPPILGRWSMYRVGVC